MDLSTVDYVGMCEKGYECVITHPETQEPTDLKIKIQGLMAPGIFAEFSAADSVEKTVEALSKMTLGWSGMKESGSDVAFSVDEAKRVYARYPFIRQQLLEAVADIGNFTPTLAKNSKNSLAKPRSSKKSKRTAQR